MIFAPLIRTARWQAGLTQHDLARQVGTSERAIWQIEQGSGSLKTLLPAMEALRVPVLGLPPGASIGARVRAARLKKMWSLQELSRRSGLSVPTVRSLEVRSAGRVASLEAVIRVLTPAATRRQRPMRPAVERQPDAGAPRVALFLNADCTEVMPTMVAGSVDLAVTSPPYQAGKEYEEAVSIEEYTAFADRWLACVPRVLSETGALWLNVGYVKLSETTTLPLTYLYYPLAVKHGLHLIQEIVWHYEGGLPYTRRFTHRTERWMWFVKDPNNYVFHLDSVRDQTLNRTADRRNSDLGKNPTDHWTSDDWYFDRVVGGRGRSSEKTEHPAQFPVAMIERIITACSHKGDVVLDPFGGAGTSAEAASRNGRGFISIEKDEGYHEIARARVARSR
ncbi:MAG TPA: DNA methyltransferase [Microvirga sp.]|jgi:adenine-specific DNA-methyltransferase|nr:DNA methyltransferase [Microvirga sp.]